MVKKEEENREVDGFFGEVARVGKKEVPGEQSSY